MARVMDGLLVWYCFNFRLSCEFDERGFCRWRAWILWHEIWRAFNGNQIAIRELLRGALVRVNSDFETEFYIVVYIE